MFCATAASWGMRGTAVLGWRVGAGSEILRGTTGPQLERSALDDRGYELGETPVVLFHASGYFLDSRAIITFQAAPQREDQQFLGEGAHEPRRIRPKNC